MTVAVFLLLRVTLFMCEQSVFQRKAAYQRLLRQGFFRLWQHALL